MNRKYILWSYMCLSEALWLEHWAAPIGRILDRLVLVQVPWFACQTCFCIRRTCVFLWTQRSLRHQSGERNVLLTERLRGDGPRWPLGLLEFVDSELGDGATEPPSGDAVPCSWYQDDVEVPVLWLFKLYRYCKSKTSKSHKASKAISHLHSLFVGSCCGRFINYTPEL